MEVVASLGEATALPTPSLCLPGYFPFTFSCKAPLGFMNSINAYISFAMCPVGLNTLQVVTQLILSIVL